MTPTSRLARGCKLKFDTGLKATCRWSTVNGRLLFSALLIAGLCLLPLQLSAGTTGKGTVTPGRRIHRKNSTRSKSLRGSHHRRVSSRRHRLAQLRPDPQRVQEIQRALTNAGELHQEPTGRWDDQTREAMRRYQTANGFSPTGLPDAKSLMKLGLGPHPLPPTADASQAGARLDPATKEQ